MTVSISYYVRIFFREPIVQNFFRKIANKVFTNIY